MSGEGLGPQMTPPPPDPLPPSEVLRRAKDLLKTGEALTPGAAIERAASPVGDEMDLLWLYGVWDAALSASLADPRDGEGLKGWTYWDAWDRAIALAEEKEKDDGD